jgi:hypothetical protein
MPIKEIMEEEDRKIIQLLNNPPTYFIYKAILKHKCKVTINEICGPKYKIWILDNKLHILDQIILEICNCNNSYLMSI